MADNYVQWGAKGRNNGSFWRFRPSEHTYCMIDMITHSFQIGQLRQKRQQVERERVPNGQINLLTRDLRVGKIGIRLPQILEMLRRQGDVVIAILEEIVREGESRFSPLLVHKHVDAKVHVLNVN
jgi:hypothetical protein